MKPQGWRLIVRDPGHRTRGFEVEPPSCLVGRLLRCDLRLGDPSASGMHARFVVDGDMLVVEDLGSTNGVWTAGGVLRRGMRRALGPGDVVGMGRTLIEVIGRRADWIGVEEPRTSTPRVDVSTDTALQDVPPGSFAGADCAPTVSAEGVRADVLCAPVPEARLLLIHRRSRRMIDVSEMPFLIGRLPGDRRGLVLRHVRISNPHLELRRAPSGEYSVVDLDSRNGTWVEGVRLEPGREHPLSSEALLSFGPLSAWFVAGAASPEQQERHRLASEQLVSEGAVSRELVDAARKDIRPGQSLGEALLLAPKSTLSLERWLHTSRSVPIHPERRTELGVWGQLNRRRERVVDWMRDHLSRES